jgi:hypothetical protein
VIGEDLRREVARRIGDDRRHLVHALELRHGDRLRQGDDGADRERGERCSEGESNGQSISHDSASMVSKSVGLKKRPGYVPTDWPGFTWRVI